MEKSGTNANWGYFIAKHIKRTNRNIILSNIGILFCALWIIFYNLFISVKYINIYNFTFPVPSWNKFLESITIWGMAVVTLICILAIRNIIVGVNRSLDYTKHPISISLAKIGPPLEVSNIVDKEISAPNSKKYHCYRITVIPFCLFYERMFRLDIIWIKDIVWIFKSVTTHKTNFVVTGKSYAMAIHLASGKKHEYTYGENIIDKTIAVIKDFAPWVIVGYSDELMHAWNTERLTFISSVNNKKIELLKNASKIAR